MRKYLDLYQPYLRINRSRKFIFLIKFIGLILIIHKMRYLLVSFYDERRYLVTFSFIFGGPQIQIFAIYPRSLRWVRIFSNPSFVNITFRSSFTLNDESSLSLRVSFSWPFDVRNLSWWKVIGWTSSRLLNAAMSSKLKAVKGLLFSKGVIVLIY